MKSPPLVLLIYLGNNNNRNFSLLYFYLSIDLIHYNYSLSSIYLSIYLSHASSVYALISHNFLSLKLSLSSLYLCVCFSTLISPHCSILFSLSFYIFIHQLPLIHIISFLFSLFIPLSLWLFKLNTLLIFSS